MRVTSVKDSDFRCPGSGQIKITQDVGETIARAVESDHYCEEIDCDIGAALKRGYPLAAAHLLLGATDPTITSRAINALVFNGLRVDLWAGFDEWCSSGDSEADAVCPACNAHFYLPMDSMVEVEDLHCDCKQLGSL